MINLLSSIFEQSEFEKHKTASGYLYCPVNQKKESYWLVILSNNIDTFLEQQAEFFNDCSQICTTPSFSKNLSTLILWETNGKIQYSELKKNIMRIEEDPFHSKKHVLYYSEKEKNSLIEQVEHQSLDVFLKEKISSTKVFQEYKNAPCEQTWQALAYRITIKIPFLTISLKDNTNLISLENKRDEKLKRKRDESSLRELESKLFGQQKMIELNGVNPVELLNKLISISEKGHGNDS